MSSVRQGGAMIWPFSVLIFLALCWCIRATVITLLAVVAYLLDVDGGGE